MPDPSLISGPACFLYATRIDAYVSWTDFSKTHVYPKKKTSYGPKTIGGRLFYWKLALDSSLLGYSQSAPIMETILYSLL